MEQALIIHIVLICLNRTFGDQSVDSEGTGYCVLRQTQIPLWKMMMMMLMLMLMLMVMMHIECIHGNTRGMG